MKFWHWHLHFLFRRKELHRFTRNRNSLLSLPLPLLEKVAWSPCVVLHIRKKAGFSVRSVASHAFSCLVMCKVWYCQGAEVVYVVFLTFHPKMRAALRPARLARSLSQKLAREVMLASKPELTVDVGHISSLTLFITLE